jgi:hypothetical protein
VRQRSKRHNQQALRTTPAPDGLQAWLDVVNGLPEITTPEDLKTLILMEYSVESLWQAQANNTQAEREEKIQELRNRTVGWGHQCVAYIFRSDTDPVEPGERLGEVISGWMTFGQIAEFGASHRASEQMRIGPPGAGVQLISRQGVLGVEVSPFMRMLDGTECGRIRLCPVCSKFFWAGRRDKPACSQQCAGALRQRRLRENRAYACARAKKRNQRRRSD